ncbi:MAG TPA: hypothetical protein PLZ93_18235 [Nocardioides sp.]|uniref:hypothetical protein n=1 Tax=uncultured Nocardioides sp. TaxID=198441 RepID=UPI000ECA5D6C|nr:hypothetical protein [uncultured Nocardioides sp.]HCB05649.1 hypothetical protein [Nocardioides sp.]HRD61395.1 hypothetical protein [Nocardioides sp.]HRI97564.1 hypothetical protein [Nocardioides sp.]HRK47907.1 hypothetical protein [Nocardioides sp.]
MKLSSLVRGKVGTVLAVGAIAVVAGTGASVAAGHITSADIKDGTIQTRDLTKNNFARFTSTETVVTAQTPVSTTPAHNGQRVVNVADTGTTPLATIVLDKGTWKIDGVAQFWHLAGPAPSGVDFGVVTVPGLQSGFGTNWTAEVPDGGANAAQTAFSGTIKITANDTPVVISGAFTGNNSGQAGVSVEATQYEYVKQFSGGQ